MASVVRSQQNGGGAVHPDTKVFKDNRACARCGRIRKSPTKGSICRECKSTLRAEREHEARMTRKA
jgi:hypothetical protein